MNAVIHNQTIKVADEVFIATALLHREHPDRDDFTLSEIVERAAQENLCDELRPGVHVHASTHCVANRPPNPGRHQMLFATATNRRRLVRQGDEVHPGRTGKVFPDPEDVPPTYGELIEWAKTRYKQTAGKPTKWLGALLGMAGLGKELWKDEDPDQYVERMREGWK